MIMILIGAIIFGARAAAMKRNAIGWGILGGLITLLLSIGLKVLLMMMSIDYGPFTQNAAIATTIIVNVLFIAVLVGISHMLIWPARDAERPDEGLPTSSLTKSAVHWVLTCQSCRREFRIGENADIVDDTRLFAELSAAGVTFGGAIDSRGFMHYEPEVVNYSSGKPIDQEGCKQVRTRIIAAVKSGEEPRWQCGQCQHINPYPAA